MESLVPTVLIVGVLGLVWLARHPLRQLAAQILLLLADILRPSDSLGYADAMHLLWAIGITDRNALRACEKDLIEFATLIASLATLEDTIERERRDRGEVSLHALSVIEDCRRDIGVVRRRIVETCLGPRTTEVWQVSLLAADEGIPYLPGADEQNLEGSDAVRN